MDRTSQAEETVRRYSDMVYRLAFARTGNTADAEDVYQEVFLRYLRSDPSSPRRSTGRPGCCGSLSTAPKSFMRRPGGGGRSPSVRRWRPPPRRERRSGRSCAACRTSTARCSTSTTTRT